MKKQKRKRATAREVISIFLLSLTLKRESDIDDSVNTGMLMDAIASARQFCSSCFIIRETTN